MIRGFETACADLRDAILSVPEDHWQAATPGDGRQVNVVAHHAASAHRGIADVIAAMLAGQKSSLTLELIHAGNAAHAGQFSTCSRSETLGVHDQGAAYALQMLRGLTESQLDVRGEFLAGRQLTVEQAVQAILIHHPREHTATIRAVLA